MNPLKFKKHRNGKIFEYHFYPKDDELIIGLKTILEIMKNYGKTGVILKEMKRLINSILLTLQQ